MSTNGKQNYKSGDLVSIMWTTTAEKENAKGYVGKVVSASDQQALEIEIRCRRENRVVTLPWSTVNPLNIGALLNTANTKHICHLEDTTYLAELEAEIKGFVEVIVFLKIQMELEANQDQKICELLEYAQRRFPDYFEVE